MSTPEECLPVDEDHFSAENAEGSGHNPSVVEPEDTRLVPDIHLKEVKRVLFYKGEAHSPMENYELFQRVMSLLSSYELAESERSAQSLKPLYLYTRLKNKIKMFKTMRKDFIFYFVLALRFQRRYNADIYQLGNDTRAELESFIKFIAKSFKKLEPEGIADTHRKFIQREIFSTKTVQPLPGAKHLDLDVFTQFLQSCQLFVEIVDEIRCKILIASMYMATTQALGNVMEKPSHFWKHHVIKFIEESSFDEILIEDIGKGREQARLFEVPNKWTFNEKLMTAIFCRNYDEKLELHPLRLMKCFLKCCASCCDECLIFVRDVLHPIRVHYKSVLEIQFDKDKRMEILTAISGNIQPPHFACVREGIMVVDQVIDIQEEKHWSEAADDFDDEIKNWLQFLLLISNPREKSAVDCYKLLTGEYKCCVKYREFIRDELIVTVEKHFSSLHVDVFIPLFKALPIWQKAHVAAYLADYAVEQFGLKLGENGWKNLLKEIVTRFPDTHEFLLGFLKSAADWYSQKHCPQDYFRDLLLLEVPKLFCVAENDFSNESRDAFHAFLWDYYKRLHTHCKFCEIMESIMSHVPCTRRNYFQDTVLQVVAKGTVKEIMDCTKASKESLKYITSKIDVSCDDSSMQIFGWTIVGELSKSLPQFDSIQKFPKQFRDVFIFIGGLYKRHCEKVAPRHKLKVVDNVELMQCTPNSSPEVKSFFNWVKCMYSTILEWRRKLSIEDVTHEDISLHKLQYIDVHEVMKALGFETLVFNRKDLESLLKKYIEKEEKINAILIRTHVEKGKTLWCILPLALQLYNLSLRADIMRDIECYVIYPKGREGVHHRIPDQKSESNNYSLKLRPETTLNHLVDLCDRLQSYYMELEGSALNFFVFFHLNNSSLFEKYLKHNIQYVLSTYVVTKPGAHSHCEVTVKVLSEAIQRTKILICCLIQGEAKYSEIVANGAVVLKDINTELEISVLEKSIDALSLPVNERNGLIGVKAMVELFKAAAHVNTLENIFQRYNLKLCAEDESFKDLCVIASRANDQLTPKDAINLLERVKTILHIPDEKSVDCLEFLGDIFNAKTFYEFLLFRRFYGKLGYKAFRQQYELITVQLQNKASQFEEMILNHLFPAFHFLSPFIGKFDDKVERMQPQFGELVSAMWELDTKFGPIKLRNVYQNIHIVLQWFSEVQGDTAKSIETELEDVMSTGIFCLKADTPFMLEFQRSAGVSMSETNPSQHLCVWHTSEIKEFVTRLGFLSSKGEKSRTFVGLNEIAQLVFDLICKIKHFEPTVSVEISCKKAPEEAKGKLQCLQERLREGRAVVTKVQMKHRWLYYIPGTLVAELYKVLSDQNYDRTLEIVLMSFPLIADAKRHKETCNAITTAIQKELSSNVENDIMQKEEFSPVAPMMEIIGCFLDRVLPMRVPEENIVQPQQHPFLHFAPGYSQEYLIRFLLEIYDGNVPTRFQVFWCDETCHEDELAYFFDRIEGVTSIYTLLETNSLPLSLQEYALRRSLEKSNSTVHYVDTKPSLFQDNFDVLEHNIPCSVSLPIQESSSSMSCLILCWECCFVENHSQFMVCGPNLTRSQVSETLRQQEPIKCSSIELVCGLPGDGKSYYILNKLKTNCSSHVVIPINEGFNRRRVIKRLCSLPLNAKSGREAESDQNNIHGIFFNFTIYLTKETVKAAEKLQKKIGWFLFELLVLGKVDDFHSGSSFQLHNRTDWEFYIEVPPLSDLSGAISNAKYLEETILAFRDQFPLFQYIGRPVLIGTISHFTIGVEAQLVCKYLKAYTHTESVSQFLGLRWTRRKDVKLHDIHEIPASECIELLKAHTPQRSSRMISQRMFVRYMYRRCQFLDMILESMARYSGNSADVCSNLFNLTLHEVKSFTDAQSCLSIPFQLIYHVEQDGRTNITVLTSKPSLIKPEQKKALEDVGIAIPTERMLRSRNYLIQCLCTTLEVPIAECDDIMAEENYVVTLDFVMKMLNINERKQCGIPVVVEGETGVGKTSLIEMLSKLWNISHRKWIKDQQQAFASFITENLGEHSAVKPDAYKKAKDMTRNGYQPKHIAYIARLPLKTGQFYMLIREYILARKYESFWHFLKHEDPTITFSDLIHDLENSDTLEITVTVGEFFLCGSLMNLFHKIAIHAALTPDQIGEMLTPILNKAQQVKEKCSALCIKPPSFVIFLDELNTSSCGGVLKEIIVDHALFGQAIPSNVFIVGASNPHRGDSTSLLESVPSLWCRTTYYVQQLHPTLRYLVWDYGALGDDQEEEYVKAKLTMVRPLDFKGADGDALCDSLTDLIVMSQNMMRENVRDCLTHKSLRKINSDDVDIASRSCVSQRDIQRIITFYRWIFQFYHKFSPHGDFAKMESEYKRRAVLVSLGIVYYLRQPDEYRKKYVEKMEISNISENITFLKAFDDDLNWITARITIPSGIVKTKALKENLFATIASICTRTPILIVGEPGSSKSLSFHLVVESLRGKESTADIFKETDIFPCVDPYFYQCSRQTTSNDIVAVFERAKGRQDSFVNSQERHCVVFMDEAGLPEESRESLKALHYYLDNPSVAFVGISNHVLDAAKTNRCVCVVRMKMSKDELEFLAKGCICDTPDNIPPDRSVSVESIIKFCDGYEGVIMKQHRNFFGLRDFVHFLHYCRRYHNSYSFSKLVLRALERNFNGIQSPVQMFLDVIKKVPAVEQDVEVLCEENSRGIIDILRESLSDSPSGENSENAVRYKLIIDPSKDNSLIRYLFKYGVVEKKNTRMFMCSDAFSDEEAQKVVIVSTICHSVTEGHTVILSQTNEINESFYDLFNLRYRCIDDPEQGRLYYTNVAVGPYIKPCRVDRNFQCIVLLQEDQLPLMPEPFLNRFEKYRITYTNMLDSAMRELPYRWRSLMQTVTVKVKRFAEEITAPASIFGHNEEIVSSLLLWCLPAKPNLKVERMDLLDHSGNSKQFLLDIVLHSLRSVGFFIPCLTREEVELDAKSLFGLICSNTEFNDYVKTLADNSALCARDDALYILNYTQQSDNPTASVGACLIISLMMQWMVRYLCRTLMQVMTPEALVVFDENIPFTYLTHYLKQQEHFDLKKLIEKHYQMMLNESASGITPTKLFVFCRTSLLVTNLTFNTSDEDDANTRVMFINKESYHTEAWFSERLNEFYASDDKCVLLIKVSMQETSINAINHMRMIVEDTENQYSTQEKLAVALVHFPLSMFSGGNYPSLFQSGWSHYYLDSVSLTQETSHINTEQWISLILDTSEVEACVSVPQVYDESSVHISSPSFTECSQLLPALKPECSFPEIVKSVQHLTEQYIPTLVSLLASKMTLNVSISQKSDLAARKAILSTLLNEREFGTLLCRKFEGYWNPSLFAAFLRKAASIIFRRESSARMSVIIQSLICGKFSDFIHYMVSVMNDSGTLYLLFNSDTPPEVLALFKAIVNALDLPVFSNLSHLNVIRRKSNLSRQTKWQFPFYSMISHSIDDIITENKNDARESLHVEKSFSLPTEVNLIPLVEAKILEICQGGCTSHSGRAIATTLKLMEENTSLLDRYLCDLFADKLSIVSVPGEVVFDALKAYLISNRDSNSSPQHSPVLCIVKRLTAAHIYFHYPRNSLTRILPIVKQLSELQQLTKKLDDKSLCIPPLEYGLDSLSLLRDTGRLCAYTINILFYYIHSVWSEDMQPRRWYPLYHKMINNQHVKKLLYKDMDISIQAKMNVMHTAYVVLSCTTIDESLSHTIFWTLVNRYFMERELKCMSNWPHLRECVCTTFDILPPNCFKFTIIHRLLEHFFSKQRSKHHQEDVTWLIELSNERTPTNIKILTDGAKHGIPFGVVKHYLSRVLTHDLNPKGNNISFMNFSKECRNAIGLELQKTTVSGPDVHYLPYFYDKRPPSCQSLAHLYLLIVMEAHFGNRYASPTSIKDEIVKLQEQIPQSDMKLLLSIEQQALIQTLLQKIAEYQALGKMGQTLAGEKRIESLLYNVSSTDMMSCHGAVIAMHLLSYCRNLCKLRQHVDHLHHNGMECLRNIADELHQPPSDNMSPGPRLLLLNSYKHLLPRYEAVCREMRRQSECNMECLLSLQKSWGKPLIPSKKVHIDNVNCLLMMMWLAAYHNFFTKDIFCEAIMSGIRGWGFIRERQLKLFEILLVRDRQCERNNFFENMFCTNCRDESVLEMRECIVNIIAVIFGTPKESNHLWYHLIEPEKLDGTFLTGFMYPKLKCSKETIFYEDGTHLTSNGLYGKYAYMADGGKRCLTLPSLYVLLWINFATFGMAEWSKPMSIPFVCEDPDSLTNCSAHLKSLWKHMTVNLDFCDEHVSNLVTNCLSGIMKASCDSTLQRGVFTEFRDVETYEEQWQDQIFEPAYAAVSKNVDDEMTSVPVLNDITDMKKWFPRSPTFDDLSYVVQTVTRHQKDLKVLSQFVIEYQRLHLGSSLLPDLVKLYQWLHQELNHSVTLETASKLTLASIKEQLENHEKNASDTSREFFELYRNILDKFSKYVSLTGRHKGVSGDLHQSHIDTNTVLQDLVSGVPNGKDCIHRVLTDIVSSHRSLLECVSNTALSNKELQLYSLPPRTEEIHLSLVSPNDCIIDRESTAATLSMLLCKWNCYLHDIPREHCHHFEFSLKELQEDVVEFYVAGKPMIQSAATLYTCFSFVEPDTKIMHQELVQIKQQLPPLFHIPLKKPEKRELEKEFHCATFEDYQSLITIFSISVHILVSEVRQAPETQLLAEKHLEIFLCSEEAEEKTFWDTETERCRLSESQMAYIKGVKLKNLFSVLEIFMKWNDAGVYDFHMLPYAVKGHISDEDDNQLVNAAQTKYRGKMTEFSANLRVLECSLVNVQPAVLASSPQTPLRSLLDKVQSPLVDCIPNSVFTHQYVSLRLIIRRLMLSCKTTLPKKRDSVKWQEYEPEPWKTSLHCVMQTTRALQSHLTPRSRAFGFGIKTVTKIDHNLQERFECTSEDDFTPRPSLRKEYMSELMTMEDNSTKFADMIMSISPGKQATDFNTNEVCKFLRVVGLLECVEWAKYEGISGADIMDSENNDDINFENSFIRLKLVVNLECLQNDCRLTAMTLQYPPSKIAEFLGYSGERYEKYIQLFLDNGVDGEILHRANDQELKDLGIPSAVDRALIKHKFEKLTTDSSQEVLSPLKVCEKLMDLKLEDVATCVKEHGINSVIFINASEDLKKDMGIKPSDFRKMRRKLK